jgi:hypothetical protein
MKPIEFDAGPRSSIQIEPHPRPTLGEQLITMAKLCAAGGVLFLVLWFVDQMVLS